MFTIDIGGLEIGISITIVLLAFICELINSDGCFSRTESLLSQRLAGD